MRTPGVGRGPRLGFPRLAHVGEEVVARRALLGEHLVAAVAVVTDRRRRHEHARLALAARDRGREHRVPRTRLSRMRRFCSSVQRLLADALAREVHDRVDTFERGRVDATGVGIPADRRRRR